MNAPELPDTQKLTFQAEIARLLHLMIHSLYGNKEVFLRELVSNASDACDKLRFESLTNPELLEGESSALGVFVECDKEQRTLTVRDNGIGMSRDEVISNLGTIAKSGTQEFLEHYEERGLDESLIGQFGVGFYSAFIVAAKVRVTTRRAGLAASEAVTWESDGKGDFVVYAASRLERGTDVTLYLKEGEDEFLSESRLRQMLRKYSDHVAMPIHMRKAGSTTDDSDSQNRGEVEIINQASAIWTRNKGSISNDQYEDFYKYIAHDNEGPLAWTHNRVEGRHEYTQLLYIPRHAPLEVGGRDLKSGVKLYVKRVFVMDEADQLIPSYMRFVQGIIDSGDLPLNVSREVLQSNRDVRHIRDGVAKRILALLEDVSSNRPEDYAIFWRACGKIFKEGAGEDPGNIDKISRLLRFSTTFTGGESQSSSLADYVSRMKPQQENIYYLIADTFDAAISSPHLELLRKKDIEVILMFDRVDEWLMSHLTEFDGKQFVSLVRGGLDLGELSGAEEKGELEKVTDEYRPLIERLRSRLGEQVSDVRITQRLVESAACVVVSDFEMSTHLQRLLRASGRSPAMTRPILEINPRHAVFERIVTAPEDDFGDWAQLVLDQALLAEGAPLGDPAGFVTRMNRLLISPFGGLSQASR